jgi:hypothetical protein
VPVGSDSLTSRSLQFNGGVSARRSISLMLASIRRPRGGNISAIAYNRH